MVKHIAFFIFFKELSDAKIVSDLSSYSTQIKVREHDPQKAIVKNWQDSDHLSLINGVKYF